MEKLKEKKIKVAQKMKPKTQEYVKAPTSHGYPKYVKVNRYN